MIERRGLAIDIQVDGNVSLENATKMVRAGANWLVGGTSSLFAPGVTIDEGVPPLRSAAQRGQSQPLARSPRGSGTNAGAIKEAFSQKISCSKSPSASRIPMRINRTPLTMEIARMMSGSSCATGARLHPPSRPRP